MKTRNKKYLNTHEEKEVGFLRGIPIMFHLVNCSVVTLIPFIINLYMRAIMASIKGACMADV